MAIRKFDLAWIGVYKASSNSYVGGSNIQVGGSSDYQSYIGLPSGVRDAIKTSKTSPKLRIKFNVTDGAEFDVGAHKETYNKASGTMPWYVYTGLHPSFGNGWATIDLTSVFMNDYKNGTRQGIVLYGSRSNYGHAYGKTNNSNEAYFEVEGTWNTAPSKVGTISSPKASTIADKSVYFDWNPATDAEQSQSSLRYQLKYFNGSSWSSTTTLAAGVTQYTWDVSNSPETTRAQLAVRAFDGELYGAWSYSDYFTISHNRPPAKPTQLSPAGGKTIDRTIIQRFAWKHNDDGSQAGFTLAWRTIASDGSKGYWNYIPSQTGFTNSTSQYYNFPANTFPAGEIEWTVRTKDQQGLSSEYATYQRFTAGEASTAPIILFPESGEQVSDSSIVAEWSSVDQAKYEIKLFEGTTTLWSSSGNGAIKRLNVGYALENNKTYQLQIRIADTVYGLWSPWASTTFTTAFTPPIKPTMTIEPVPDNSTIVLSWQNDADRNLAVNGDLSLGKTNGWRGSISNVVDITDLEGFTKALRTQTTTNTAYPQFEFAEAGYDVNMFKGKVWNASMYIKLNVFTYTGAGKGKNAYARYTVDGQNQYFMDDMYFNAPTNGWVRVDFAMDFTNVTGNLTSVFVGFGIDNASASDVYITGLQVTEGATLMGSPDTPMTLDESIITNGGFSDGTTGWRNWQADTVGTRTVESITDLPEFSNAAKLVTNANTGEFGYAQDYVPINKSSKYVMSAWFKVTAGSGTVKLQRGNATAGYKSVSSSQFTLGQWFKLEQEFTPEDASLNFYVGQSSSTEGMTIYATGIEVREKDYGTDYVKPTPQTTYVKLFKREYDDSQELPWQQLGDILAPNSTYTDYTPASDMTYEYKLEAWGDNDTYTESDIYEGEVIFLHAFLHRAILTSDLLIIDSGDSRDQSLDLKGNQMFFAGRRLPVFEFGENEENKLNISWIIDTVDDFTNTLKFLKRRETFLYRDGNGRRMYCVVQAPKVTDRKVSGFEISLTLLEVDYKEE
ncbi:minor tail protein [Bacillus phage 019DV002]|uniref:Minor tail protein n=1 Tax=Bacillus phage 019DV002 TaxID=2601653 RepID=A0A5J6T7L8_9CAUD|nr:minor tail protein [Bacillus phage 019DV002]QFG05256.1 minor tail protein [Bacillus phage 019DV004]